ncbi:MAG: hypothetical protein GY893_14700 [bacterium]|nr:hypothetical protein [bacterium]
MFLRHTQPSKARDVAAAIVGACRGKQGWASDFQPKFLQLVFDSLLGVNINFDAIEGMNVETAQKTFTTSIERTELIELFVLTEVVLHKVPSALELSIEYWAKELMVDDRSLVMARDIAFNSRLQAQSDFYRLMWMGEEDKQMTGFSDLLMKHGPKAFTFTVEKDNELNQQWRSLSKCQQGSLGEAVLNHYQVHNFILPGEIGGANAALAHHDWLHVIGDYKVDVIGEIENAAFGSATSSIPGSTLWFLGVMAMYEGGLFDSTVTGGQSGWISKPGVAERIAKALKKGKQCSQDLLDIDFFSIANHPLIELQESWNLL